MREYNCDLHFHGPYSGGVSKNMLIPVIAEQARLKGLHVISTADILHAKWLEHVKESITEQGNGIFADKKSGEINFIPGTEIEDRARVHHLLYFPDFASAANLKEKWRGKANFDSWGCGRPRVRLNGEEIAAAVDEVGGICGPAHAFTPYFSIYSHHESVEKCYGSLAKKIYFMELGLSADTDIADMIPDNRNYAFCTNSDSHSPWPYRIGREFNRIRMKEPCFAELADALKEREEKRITLNVGLDPCEGKYHMTACNACFAQYSAKRAAELNWKCLACGGAIKKGAHDLIAELSERFGNGKAEHPEFRPPYMHTIPLAEIIQIALHVEGVNTAKVQGLWKDFVERFGNEISALIDAPVEELAEVNADAAKKINAFRKGWVFYIPGGGGKYGTPVIGDSPGDLERRRKEAEQGLKKKNPARGQRTLGDF
ncbi:MAG: TIGR00375 family protein [Candidatus Diapherotrites archaeon]